LSHRLLIERKALKYLSELPEKSQRLIKEKCHALSDDPYPGQGGDKELLHLDYKLYRLHIGRSFTVFYQICEEDGQVKILEITTIERAHKLYRRLEE
jgi:mRNA interferase RelE/StbE